MCCWTNELKRDAQEDYAFTLPKFAERMETVRGKYSNVFREDIYEFVLTPKLRDISSTLRVLGLKTIGSFINGGYPSGPEIVNRVWFDIRDVFSEAQKQEVTDLLNAWNPGFIEDGTDPWH
ncbi:hypothetical protein A9762_14955 [Pandoraea sp. ISTKB]|nr:hypothetical protein A9762_14955 [Pandoraea sp. ISTKB]